MTPILANKLRKLLTLWLRRLSPPAGFLANGGIIGTTNCHEDSAELACFVALFTLCGALPDRTVGQTGGSAVEIVAVRDNGVDIKLRRVWPYPVSVWVCDTPQRLNDLGYHIEAFRGRKWVRLKPPEGIILGDLPPTYLEIGEGRTDSLRANFLPASFGIKSGVRVRIVVNAWRTETNAIGMVGPVSKEPLLLTSAPFAMQVKP